jgi:hypothetical protein
MAQASKSDTAKKCILKALERQPNGIRYNKLFELVRKEVVSLSTFEKYLTELEKVDYAVERTPDPSDPRAKVIRANPEPTRRELIWLDGLKKIREIAQLPPRRYESWKAFEKAFQDSRKDLATRPQGGKYSPNVPGMRHRFLEELITEREPVFELVKIAHSMFIEMQKSPFDIYLRVVELKDGKERPIKGLEVLHCDEVLRLRRESAELADLKKKLSL